MTIPKQHLSLYITIIPLLLIVACSKKETSEGIKTENMHLSALVIADNTDSVHVQASVGDSHVFGTDYFLSGNDNFLACVEGGCARLERSTIEMFSVLPPYYSGSLPYYSGSEYVFSLNRSGYASAPNSKISMPESFEILEPMPSVSYSDGDEITIRWFPSGVGESVSVKTNPGCIHEDGSESFNSGDLKTDPDGNGEEISSIEDILYVTLAFEESPIVRCDIEVEVEHQRFGEIDPAYGGGFVSGSVRRTVQVQYLPSL